MSLAFLRHPSAQVAAFQSMRQVIHRQRFGTIRSNPCIPPVSCSPHVESQPPQCIGSLIALAVFSIACFDSCNGEHVLRSFSPCNSSISYINTHLQCAWEMPRTLLVLRQHCSRSLRTQRFLPYNVIMWALLTSPHTALGSSRGTCLAVEYGWLQTALRGRIAGVNVLHASS